MRIIMVCVKKAVSFCGGCELGQSVKVLLSAFIGVCECLSRATQTGQALLLCLSPIFVIMLAFLPITQHTNSLPHLGDGPHQGLNPVYPACGSRRLWSQRVHLLSASIRFTVNTVGLSYFVYMCLYLYQLSTVCGLFCVYSGPADV